MAKCRIDMQSVNQGGWVVPMWYCQEHRIPVAAGDNQCAVGRVEEAGDSQVARIELEFARKKLEGK